VIVLVLVLIQFHVTSELAAFCIAVSITGCLAALCIMSGMTLLNTIPLIGLQNILFSAEISRISPVFAQLTHKDYGLLKSGWRKILVESFGCSGLIP
jgi:hypothetical protein